MEGWSSPPLLAAPGPSSSPLVPPMATAQRVRLFPTEMSRRFAREWGMRRVYEEESGAREDGLGRPGGGDEGAGRVAVGRAIK